MNKGRNAAVSPVSVYRMRQAGATLQRIADTVGRSKERVRQILIASHGSSKCQLISSEQLSHLLNVPRSRIVELRRAGVITPAAEFTTGSRVFMLWSPGTLVRVRSYLNQARVCRVCGTPLAKGRRVYCSTACSDEGHKYRNRSEEAKRRHLDCVKRYREKRRRLALMVKGLRSDTARQASYAPESAREVACATSR